jgi:hypothetical protein
MLFSYRWDIVSIFVNFSRIDWSPIDAVPTDGLLAFSTACMFETLAGDPTPLTTG